MYKLYVCEEYEGMFIILGDVLSETDNVLIIIYLLSIGYRVNSLKRVTNNYKTQNVIYF